MRISNRTKYAGKATFLGLWPFFVLQLQDFQKESLQEPDGWNYIRLDVLPKSLCSSRRLIFLLLLAYSLILFPMFA